MNKKYFIAMILVAVWIVGTIVWVVVDAVSSPTPPPIAIMTATPEPTISVPGINKGDEDIKDDNKEEKPTIDVSEDLLDQEPGIIDTPFITDGVKEAVDEDTD